MSDFIKDELGKPEEWLLAAASTIGLDLSEFIHEITSDLLAHSLKRHGNPAIHGAATITNADFEYISDIIKAPDYAIIGAVRKTALINAYAKMVDAITYLYFEEILMGRKNKCLRGKTFYKVTKPLSFEDFCKNVSRNEKTDISKAQILNRNEDVQTAGGSPGG
ncbi:MAG: hypothetical protein LBU99_01305 [Spirochaetaceae bacterium]|nr:hypothetical protein [Spirochaetaceae bacterium]